MRQQRLCCGPITTFAIGLFAASLVAQDDTHWSSQYDRPGLVGRAFALGTFDGDLIAGGDGFQADGHILRNVARFDGAQWHPLGEGVNEQVRAITTYNGELVIGGRFSASGTRPLGGVARWDGSSWQPLGGGLVSGSGRAYVFDLAVYQGELYAAGEFQFTNSGGQSVAGIARWNGSQWQPVGGGLTGQGSSGPGAALSFCVHNNELYVGGAFRSAGGVASYNVAVWDGSSWRGLQGGLPHTFNSSVFALAEFQGEVYAGFNYDTTLPNGQVARKVAAWDGSSWSTLGSGIPDWTIGSTVFALEVYGGGLYAGGTFVSAGGVSASRVARWDGSAWHDDGGVAGADTATTVLAMTTWGQELVVGGEFDLAGRSFAAGQPVVSDSIARYDGTDWDSVGRGLGLSGDVFDLVHWNGGIVAVGRFTRAGRALTSELAFLRDGEWRRLGTFDNYVNAAIVHNGDLVVTGQFRTVDGVPIAGIARYDGTRWLPYGNGAGGHSLAVFQNQLYAGGLGGVRRWNGTSWEFFAPQLFGIIEVMEVYGGELYMAGTINSPSIGHIAVWDGQTQSGVGGGLDRPVRSLTVFQNELIVGGEFTTAGGTPAPRIARWDGSAWRAFGNGLGGDVLALSVLNGELYAGGQFNAGTGDPVQYIGRWNGSGWSPLGSGLLGAPLALLADEALGRLYVGGLFFRVGASTPAWNMAHWEAGAAWSDLGSGTPGSHGDVLLRGFGAIAGGNRVSWQLDHGDPRQLGLLVASSARGNTSLLGGTLVPAPGITLVFATGPGGSYETQLRIPTGLLPGVPLYVQALLPDAGAGQGLAFSNAITAVSQ